MRRFRLILLTALSAALAACAQVSAPGPVPERAAPSTPRIGASAAPTDLFFSEYVEGAGNDKALEVYNGTGAAVDLAAGGYNVQMFFNGNPAAGLTIALSGTVAAGDVHVVAQASAAAAILAVADQTDGAGWFNGDDAVVLRRGDVVLDVIGQVGSDPGSEWGGGLASTGDNTLRRLASVCAGDPDGSDAFDPAAQWVGFAQGTVDGLGAHATECTPRINEFVANHVGSDTNEYVEVLGAPDTDLGTLALLQVEGDDGGTGLIDGVYPLGTTDAAGFWTTGVLANQLENGTMTLLLVEGFTGAVGDDLDVDDDGTVDVTPWTALLDAVAVNDGGAGDRTYLAAAAATLAAGFDGVAFTPGGASRVPDGYGPWVRNDFDLAGIDGFVGTPDAGEALNTPGAANAPADGEPPPPGPCDVSPLPIPCIQGSGDSAAITGLVTVQGVVVGDFEGATSLRGFYLQDPVGDGDPATSDGIFVFDAANLDRVSVGDLVEVVGNAGEFQGQTQISATSVTVLGRGTVAPVDVTLPVPSATYLERYEGMLVRLPQTLTVTEHFQLGRFGQVVLSSGGRLPQPTQVATPGAAALARQAENALNRLILDDALQTQNPDPIVFGRDGQPLSASNTLRGGDTATGIVGVLGFTWAGNSASGNAYRVRPVGALDGFVRFDASNPRPTAAPDVGGSLRVGVLNVLNYFDTLDRPGTDLDCGNGLTGGPAECRGADSDAELERQAAKLVAAIVGLDADVLGLVEIENDGYGPDSALADLVARLDAATAPGTWAYVDADVGTGQVDALGTDAIKVALLYRPASVTPVGATAALNTTSFVTGGDVDARNRPALAQAFTDLGSGGTFVAVVNHLKSKGSACDAPDAGDGQGNCNQVRTNAAQELAAWLATDPTGTGDPDVLILGDLNAYALEDPVAVLEGAGFTNLQARFGGLEASTYVFDGQWGSLDHALASASLNAQVTGAAAWAINADEPGVLDYNTEFKSANLVASLYAPDAFRSSDHDPLVVGLELRGPPDCRAAAPSRTSLWPANHRMVTVAIGGVVGADTVVVTSVFQDEPVDAVGNGDGATRPDAALRSDGRVDLRAERAATGNGRVYHVGFLASDAFGGRCEGSVTVAVPRNQGRFGSVVDDGALFDATQP